MSRHTSPKRKLIEDAYPVRIKVAIPPNGLGNLIGEMQVWLVTNTGSDRFAHLSTRSIGMQATAYYFRDLRDAQAFLEAFPSLTLADGVKPVC